MEIHINKFGGKVLTSFLKLDKENMEERVNKNVKEGWSDKMNKKDIESYLKKDAIYTIKTKNSLIGFLIFVLDKDRVYIRNIQVKKKFQGKGVGTKVLSYIEKEARKEDYRNLELSVFKDNPAVRLYERNGYKIVKDKMNNLVLMRKNL
jgi:ribosomal protein S18 acetylase RimI-like enzyme